MREGPLPKGHQSAKFQTPCSPTFQISGQLKLLGSSASAITSAFPCTAANNCPCVFSRKRFLPETPPLFWLSSAEKRILENPYSRGGVQPALFTPNFSPITFGKNQTPPATTQWETYQTGAAIA